jgi:hypothetical protein
MKTRLVDDWMTELSFSAAGSERQQAAQSAWICSNEAKAKMLRDDSFTSKDFPAKADMFDWVSNVSGSILLLIPQPAYADYLNRQDDAAATLRLVATILWLRQTHGNGEPLAVRLQQRPAWMHMADDRDLHLSKDAHSLHMSYHAPGHTGITEWPLGNIQR